MRSVWLFLYSAALAAAALPAAVAKARRAGLAGLHLRERLAPQLGFAQRPLWVNAASVGELGAVAGLVGRLRERQPDLPLLVTCSAEAGRQRITQLFDVPPHALPLDFNLVMRRFMRRLRPRLCIAVEQELWPNMLFAARREGIPFALVNGRLSARTARRHAGLNPLCREMFASLALVDAQQRADARRFRALGARQVVCSGNLKFDRQPDAALVAQGLDLRQRLLDDHPGRQVLLLASTRASGAAGEEQLLLDALGGLLDKLVVVLVPRHPERFDQVARLLDGRRIAYARRSALPDGRLPAVILGDTLGEMDAYVACADLVFVGASLIDSGGQNPMEAMAQARPVVMGPHMRNFAALAGQAVGSGAAVQADGPQAVAAALDRLSGDSQLRQRMGAAGQRLARDAQGATARALDALAPLLAGDDAGL